MGNKTWKTLPHQLKDRTNIVIAHNQFADDIYPYFDGLGLRVYANSPQKALDFAKHLDEDIYIIGGLSIYKQYLDMGVVDELIVTHINNKYNCDLFFPSFPEYYCYKQQKLSDMAEVRYYVK